jgi:GntR family transcriptional repressor for pyruvate dehydrogenase complex
MTSSGQPRFAAIEQLRAHEYVAEQIRRQIFLGLVPAGAALPPERELATMFGVGRMTVQLAIGLLEADRLVETRRGRRGGSFVRAPHNDDRAMDQRLVEVRRRADQIEQVLTYRLIVEPAAAGLAATEHTETELGEIRDAAGRTERATTDAEFMASDTQVHLAIARASHNRFLVEAIERIRLDLHSALALLPESDLWHKVSNQEHSGIIDAVAARDAKRANRLMHKHAERANESIRSLLEALSRWR